MTVTKRCGSVMAMSWMVRKTLHESKAHFQMFNQINLFFIDFTMKNATKKKSGSTAEYPTTPPRVPAERAREGLRI